MNSSPAVAMNIWKPRIKENNTELPKDFVPLPYTVHIGRGKVCSEATGNRRLKVIVDSFLQEYRKASTKIEKSVIVSKIVDIVHDACPVGAFVKFQKGKWWEVGDCAAREKVGSMLRDALSEKYRSSSKAKLARRKQAKEAVYEAAKSNVINAILSIKHEDTTETDDDAADEKITQEKETPKKQSPEEPSSSCATTMPTTKTNSNKLPIRTDEEERSTRTEARILWDLKQEKSLIEVPSTSTTTAATTSQHPIGCAPIQISSFYDINYNSNAVGLQWYSL